MATLLILPWCRIEEKLEFGELTIIPYKRDSISDDFSELEYYKAKTVLAAYRNLNGHPVSNSAVVKYNDREIFSNISWDEYNLASEWIQILCFSALSSREYFGSSDRYCNSHNFTFVGHNFKEQPDFTTIITRTPVGQISNAGWSYAEVQFTIPVHCSGINTIKFDHKLREALCSYKLDKENHGWQRWNNSIHVYNLANTDSNDFDYQVDWVLLCSAFQQFLDAKSEDSDMADKFENAISPQESLAVSKSSRHSPRWHTDSTLRYEWMREFYHVRGDYAHGILESEKQMAWQELEHQALAKIIFPYVVKVQLSRSGYYNMSDEDKTIINMFENLADRQFLTPPENQRNSYDSWWKRLYSDFSFHIHNNEILAALKE